MARVAPAVPTADLSVALMVAGALLGGCGGSPAPSSTAPTPSDSGIELPWSPDTCAARTADADFDGLEDACEFSLAAAFAPELAVSPFACNVERDRIQGGYAFAVFPGVVPGQVLIGYAPAYVRDCGWEGPKCWLRLRGGCTGHGADSEFIGLAIEFDPPTARWTTVAVFLSSHCFGASDSDCRWFGSDELGALEWLNEAGGPIRVWVAEGKNANYPTRDRCDRGHWWYDTCDRNELKYRFPVERPSQNVGDPLGAVGTQPGGTNSCLSLTDLGWTSVGGGADMNAVECFGGEELFRGWLPPGAIPEVPVGATSYRRYFRLLLDGPCLDGTTPGPSGLPC